MQERDDTERRMPVRRASGFRGWLAGLRLPSLSLRSRLILLVLGVLLPGTLAAMWVAWQSDEERLQRHLRDNVRALSTVVDRELAQRAAIARVLSLSRMLDPLPEVDAAQLQQLQEQARRALLGLEGWVVLSTADETLFSTQPGSTRRPRPAGAPPLVTRPMVGNVGVPAVGEPPHASLVQPVERQGRVLANIEVTVLASELQRIIDRQDLPAPWAAAVIDGEGRVVAGSPGVRLMSNVAEWPELQGLMLAQDEALLRGRSPAGEPVLAYFSTSSQGWSFLISAPHAGLASGHVQAVLPVIAGSVVLLSMGVAGALWLSQRISRPLDELASMAQSLQTGRPLQQRTTGIDEWDHVSRALVVASEAMRQSRSELERRVAEAVERTRETEQLSSRSQRIAALGRLTGGVAHDFNNLLGIISNSAHLIQRHVQTEALQVPLGAIRRSVEVGSRLTQHLLRFAGQQAVHPQALDLASSLTDLRVLLSTVLGKRVELSMDLQPGVRLVTADPSELELALINIGLNARDALNGAGHVHFVLRNAAPQEADGLAPGDYVVVEIIDDGPGIPADILPRVFEPFFTGKPAGRATGLGLSQVMGFCVQAGGTARIASPPGGGTVVTLVLPATQSRPGIAAAPEASSSLAGTRVMLVEDNEELSRVTATLLRSFACQVICVYDADEALRSFGTGAGIDVVLSDVMMPGPMDGMTLVQALRALRPDLPAVLISGYSEGLSQAPGLIILRKPCSPAQLLDALRRAIAGRHPPQDLDGG